MIFLIILKDLYLLLIIYSSKLSQKVECKDIAYSDMLVCDFSIPRGRPFVHIDREVIMNKAKIIEIVFDRMGEAGETIKRTNVSDPYVGKELLVKVHENYIEIVAEKNSHTKEVFLIA